MSEDNKSKLKSEVAKEKLRDGEGHFIHTRSSLPAEDLAKEGQNPIAQFISQHTHYDKSGAFGSEAQTRRDDLLDVHVGNPLKKITLLLEEIKRQKAFSFTLKGSLGIMGAALTLSVFGIFGTGQILCEKGTQSEIGTVRILQIKDQEPSVPILSSLISLIFPISPISSNLHNRVILIQQDLSVITLSPTYPKSLIPPIFRDNTPVIVTGDYNSCSRTLTINDLSAIEPYGQ